MKKDFKLFRVSVLFTYGEDKKERFVNELYVAAKSDQHAKEVGTTNLEKSKPEIVKKYGNDVNLEILAVSQLNTLAGVDKDGQIVFFRVVEENKPVGNKIIWLDEELNNKYFGK